MATIQTINIGTSANDNTGDTLRNAFDKTNQNNTALNNDLALKATLASPTITGTLTTVNDAVINSVKVGKGAGNIGSNTAVGGATLPANTSGVYNSAFGLGSMLNNQGGSTNTAMGGDSLFYNISGNNNTAIGNGALQNSTLNNNTAIGNVAGLGITTQSNSTCLGYNAQVTASNQVQLGDSATTTYVYGTVQNRSDIRDKADVRDTVLGLHFINSLRAVDYKWDYREDYRTEMPTQGELSDEDFKILMDEWLESSKFSNLVHDGSKKRARYHHGLIAQEVQDVIEASGVDFGGFQDHTVNGGDEVMTISYMELITPMIKAIQELTARINVLEGN